MYGGQEGSATKAAAYNTTYVATKLRLAAATLHYGGCQCRIVAAAKCLIYCNSVPHEFLIKLNFTMIDTTQSCICKRCMYRVSIARYGLNKVAS